MRTISDPNDLSIPSFDEWDFPRANHMVEVINVQMNELREEKEALL